MDYISMETLQNFQEVGLVWILTALKMFFHQMHNIIFVMNHIYFMLGGRKGAAVLCELLKKGEGGGPQGPGYPGTNPRSRPGRPGYQDRGYPDYHGNRNRPYN